MRISEAPAIPYDHCVNDTVIIFYDLVYNPAKTLCFFKSAEEEQGADHYRTVHEMLMIQAEESWRVWNEQAINNKQFLQKKILIVSLPMLSIVIFSLLCQEQRSIFSVVRNHNKPFLF